MIKMAPGESACIQACLVSYATEAKIYSVR